MIHSTTPPWYFNSCFVVRDGTFAGQYADAVFAELLVGGAERVTMSAVARQFNCVPSAVHHMCGGRQEFLMMVIQSFGRVYVNWLRGPSRGMPFVLPVGEDEIHAVRVWLALSDIAAGEARAGWSVLAELMDRLSVEELEAVLFRRSRPGDPPLPYRSDLESGQTRAVLAAVHGLRAAMVSQGRPLPLERALAVSEALASTLTHM